MAYGMHEVCDIYFINLTTNEPELFFDSLKVTTLDITANNVKAKGGKGNATLLSWDSDKEIKLTMEDALLDMKAFAAKSGNALSTGATTLYKREVLTVADDTTTTNNKVTLSKTPITGSVTIWNMVGDNPSTKITPITVTGSTASWLDANGPAVGGTVMAFYQYTSDSSAELVEFKTDTFSGYYRIVGDTLLRDEATGADVPCQMVIEKAKLMSGTSVKMDPSGDPSTFNFECEAYKPAGSKQLVRFIKYT